MGVADVQKSVPFSKSAGVVRNSKFNQNGTNEMVESGVSERSGVAINQESRDVDEGNTDSAKEVRS